MTALYLLSYVENIASLGILSVSPAKQNPARKITDSSSCPGRSTGGFRRYLTEMPVLCVWGGGQNSTILKMARKILSQSLNGPEKYCLHKIWDEIWPQLFFPGPLSWYQCLFVEAVRGAALRGRDAHLRCVTHEHRAYKAHKIQ